MKTAPATDDLDSRRRDSFALDVFAVETICVGMVEVSFFNLESGHVDLARLRAERSSRAVVETR